MKIGPLVTTFCHLALEGLIIMTHRIDISIDPNYETQRIELQ